MNITYKRYEGFYNKQKEMIDCPSRFTYTMASNKTGKTFSCAVWLLEQAIMNNDCHFSWIGYTFKIAEIGFDLCKSLLSSAKLENLCKFNISKLIITLPNKSIIRFFGAENPDSIFGYENFAAVMDEASRCKEESYNALLTTLLATNGPIKCIGNPTIKNNWYYRRWSNIYNSENMTNGEESAFKLTALDAIEAGIMSQATFDFAKKTYSPAIFKRDFLAEVADGETNVFMPDKIYENIIDGEFVNQLNKVKYIGIDLGFTIGKKSDWTVIIGLDKVGKVVFFKRFKAEGEELINKLKSYINNRPAYIDNTGGGITIFQLLKKDCKNLEPYTFTNQSKILAIETLAHYIHTNKISYYNNDTIIDELLGYEIDITAKGKTTYSNGKSVDHDDVVISLALAVLKYKEKEDNGEDYTFNVYTFEDEEEDTFESIHSFEYDNVNY